MKAADIAALLGWPVGDVVAVEAAVDRNVRRVLGMEHANHTRVSLGKAAHRCHGDGRCTDRCVLVGPWVVRRVRGGLFKDAEGRWAK